LRNEQGFGLVELLIAMSVMSIALSSIVCAFSSGTVAMARAGKVTTASTLADAQMETYRAMTSRDIGLDISAGSIAGLDATYKADAACWDASTSKDCSQAGVSASFALIGPRGAAPNSCTTINGWYPNTLPCAPIRTITPSTSPASPDARSYRIDTYISMLPATSTQRSREQVTVVVRDAAQLTRILSRETSIFDCSTGGTPSSTDC
jgi:prepilin-type N-terminal cleavage/methylation domain-containing protein